MVQGTDNDGGLLRIGFEEGDTHDDPLEQISWEEFFERFENEALAFVYEDETKDGSRSRFCKLVSRQK